MPKLGMIFYFLILTFLIPSMGFAESDKVDIKKLEEQYWSSKDNDFSVVQNRTYTKAKRPYLSLDYGTLMNDGFSTGRIQSINAGYFFSERWGVEVCQEKGSLKRNDTTEFFQQQYGTSPDYNQFKDSLGVNVIFVPFYAKMSWMDKTVLYFDMSVALGIGKLNYDVQLDRGSETHSTNFYNIDFSQHLFFTRNLALRLDLKNKFSTQKLYKYHIPATQSESTRFIKDDSQQDTTLLLGLTFFY